jgi:predicted nuclease of restriction endonuclease-like (RecB) superfamily
MKQQPETTDSGAFFTLVEEVTQMIKAAQYRALQSVNQQQTALYWSIGQLIVERLWYMRQLFVEYNQSELLQPVVGEISWSKHLLILAKCKDEHQRFFYIKMTAQHRWSKTALSNAIAGRLWENTLIHQHNFEETLQKQKPKIASNSERLTSHPKHRRQLPRRFSLIFDSQPLRSLSPYGTRAFAGCPPGSQSCRTRRLGELFPGSIGQ